MTTSFRQVRAVAAAAFAAAALVVHGQDAKTMPLAEARAQIGAIAADPSSMKDVISRLSPEDQCAFLGEVNAAISKMPGSNEEKTAKFLNVNRAALKGAAKGNLPKLLAEVFATVPPESLVVIHERFAADLLNRNGDPSRKYSDKEFLIFTTNLMARIEQRTTGIDDAGVRNAFAALMFLKSSGETPQPGLAEALVSGFPDQASRDMALNDWIPQATGDSPNYDSMLGYADAGAQPNMPLVLDLAGPQVLDSMLPEIMADSGITVSPIVDQAFGGFGDAPTTAQPANAGVNFGGGPASEGGGSSVVPNPGGGGGGDEPEPGPTPPVPPTPPYDWTTP